MKRIARRAAFLVLPGGPDRRIVPRAPPKGGADRTAHTFPPESPDAQLPPNEPCSSQTPLVPACRSAGARTSSSSASFCVRVRPRWQQTRSRTLRRDGSELLSVVEISMSSRRRHDCDSCFERRAAIEHARDGSGRRKVGGWSRCSTSGRPAAWGADEPHAAVQIWALHGGPS